MLRGSLVGLLIALLSISCGSGNSGSTSPSLMIAGLQLFTNDSARNVTAMLQVGQTLELVPQAYLMDQTFEIALTGSVYTSSNPSVVRVNGISTTCQGTHSVCLVVVGLGPGEVSVVFTNPTYGSGESANVIVKVSQ